MARTHVYICTYADATRRLDGSLAANDMKTTRKSVRFHLLALFLCAALRSFFQRYTHSRDGGCSELARDCKSCVVARCFLPPSSKSRAANIYTNYSRGAARRIVIENYCPTDDDCGRAREREREREREQRAKCFSCIYIILDTSKIVIDKLFNSYVYKSLKKK